MGRGSGIEPLNRSVRDVWRQELRPISSIQSHRLKTKVRGDLSEQPVRHRTAVGEIIAQIPESMQACALLKTNPNPASTHQPSQRTDFDDVVVAPVSVLPERRCELPYDLLARRPRAPPRHKV